jgi:hypothetical protein
MNTLADKITEKVEDLANFYVNKDMYFVIRVLDLIQEEVDSLAKKGLTEDEFFGEFEKSLEEMNANYFFADTELEIWEEFMEETTSKSF